jgi:hypothetical protein
MNAKVKIGEQIAKSYLKFEHETGVVDSYVVINSYVKAVVVTKVGIGIFDLEDLTPIFN